MNRPSPRSTPRLKADEGKKPFRRSCACVRARARGVQNVFSLHPPSADVKWGSSLAAGKDPCTRKEACAYRGSALASLASDRGPGGRRKRQLADRPEAGEGGRNWLWRTAKGGNKAGERGCRLSSTPAFLLVCEECLAEGFPPDAQKFLAEPSRVTLPSRTPAASAPRRPQVR
jgi:hypothetical protein